MFKVFEKKVLNELDLVRPCTIRKKVNFIIILNCGSKPLFLSQNSSLNIKTGIYPEDDLLLHTYVGRT